MRRAVLRGVGALMGVVLLLGLLEAFFAFYGKRHPFLFRFDLDPATIRVKEAERFFQSKHFDPDLVKVWLTIAPHFAATARQTHDPTREPTPADHAPHVHEPVTETEALVGAGATRG